MDENLYILEEDLYRVGTEVSSTIELVRVDRDITTEEIGEITHVISDGQGVSLFNETGLKKSLFFKNAKIAEGKWAWEIKSSTPLPKGLRIVNGKKGHRTLVPSEDMPLSKYIDLLNQVVGLCQRKFKLTDEIAGNENT